MKSIHVLSSIQNPSAGPSYCVGALVDRLNLNGCQSALVANGKKPSYWPHATKYSIPDGNSFSSEDISSHAFKFIDREASSDTILHGHGIWKAANLFPVFCKNIGSNPIVWSPMGMMTEWSMNHRRTKKKIYWELFQKRSLAHVACFHATAYSEYEDIRRCGFKQPVAVIPIGVDAPDIIGSFESKKKNILFLSRIHEKKGVDFLVDIWAELSIEFPDWHLNIAGPIDSDFAKKLVDSTKKRQVANISFLGEVLAENKNALFNETSLFVLPSFSENFGIVVAEALIHGVPVITTHGTPWQGLVDHNAGWVVSCDYASVKEAIRKSLSIPLVALHEMGQRGTQWMKAEYSWDSISAETMAVYSWLQKNTEKPKCVILD